MFKRIKKIKKIAQAATMLIVAAKGIETYGKRQQEKAAQKTVVENSRILQAKALREKFNQIKVGDLSDRGSGGSSKGEVIELLDQPNNTTDATIQDVAVEVDTWRRNEIVITVQFDDNLAVSKNVSGFKWGKRVSKLTLEVFNNLETGSTYEEIVELIGEPDGYNESKINGVVHVTATWRTGLSGERGANAILMFRDGKLTSKSQAHLI